MKSLLLATTLTAISLPALAAPATAPAPTTAPAAVTAAAAPVISKKFHDDVMTMLQTAYGPRIGELTKLVSTMLVHEIQAKHRDISPEVADELQADITKIMSDPDHVHTLEEDLVPVYASIYTDDEVLQVIAFSKTPAGTKLFSGKPDSEQLNPGLQSWMFGTVMPQMMADMAAIFKKHGVNLSSGGN